MGVRIVVQEGELIREALRRFRKENVLQRRGVGGAAVGTYHVDATQKRRAKRFRKRFKARRATLLGPGARGSNRWHRSGRRRRGSGSGRASREHDPDRRPLLTPPCGGPSRWYLVYSTKPIAAAGGTQQCEGRPITCNSTGKRLTKRCSGPAAQAADLVRSARKLPL